ncbi:MAG: hypothetical protein E2P02_21170 [Acidobacteria bacterium]|nr:MAG: hypothetical protein E2P02_21170 [Acidobacteriota bacterium]
MLAVVKSEPSWDALPPETTWRLRELLSWCFRKEQPRRLREISVAGVYLEAALDEPTRHAVHETAPKSASAWSVIVAAAMAASLVTWMATSKARDPQPVTKVRVGLQPGKTLGVFYQGPASSISPLSRTAMVFLPDGRGLIFSAENGEQGQLYLRRLDERDAMPIAGTDGAIGPFLSPDGSWVGFRADGKLKKVPIEGGAARALCDLPYPPQGVSWGRDATIVFGQRVGPILRISAEGGLPEPVTTLQDEYNHLLPRFLPDGKRILFTSRSNRLARIGSWEGTNLVLQSLENGERKLLMEDAADGRFAPTGHVVFVRVGTLMAASFDPNRGEITGVAVPVVESLRQAINAGGIQRSNAAGQFSFSASGSLAYVPGGIFPPESSRLVWVDRSGDVEPLLAVPTGNYLGPRVSPDGDRVAVWKDVSSIWIYNISATTWSRLGSTETVHGLPIWTPDGGRLSYSALDDNLHWTLSDGSGPSEPLTTKGGVPLTRGMDP